MAHGDFIILRTAKACIILRFSLLTILNLTKVIAGI